MVATSIDELLLGSKTHLHPATPENQYIEQNESDDLDSESFDSEQEPEEDEIHEEEPRQEEPDEPKELEAEVDEYGNQKEPENKEIRDRLKKQAESMERRHRAEIEALQAQLSRQGASQEVQQAAKDFEYDPEAKGDWQQQLASFIKQTVTSMTREQQETQARHAEAEQQRDFESKFRQGMSKFDDFGDVIQGLSFEITNPMTLATRNMENPAAFLYAAAKRNPQELERISKMRDPYAQIAEMGKLEERMRKNTPSTKAPRPLSRTNEEANVSSFKKNTNPTVEDLIAKSDAERISKVKSRIASRTQRR